MAIFEVTLDGGVDEPERNCTLTVEAKDADAAKEFAEEHNPGLTATEATKA
jgi:hypothetical protein